MSNTKTVMGQASNQYVTPLDITDVFSTYLYDGTNDDGPNPTQTITNGIDLSGEGGLVWTKARDYSANHALVDTVRGNTKYLESDGSGAESTTSVGITAFNSNGYTLGADNTWKFNVDNAYVSEYASWTFRKAPKFFDVVTYTGNRVNTSSFQDIPHNLGSTPGMIIVKETSSADDWMVYHRSVSVDGTVFKLNTTDAATNFGNVIFDVSEINDSTFRVGNMNNVNANGSTYVAYLFAHNDGDGGFGPTGDQDIIKCGSYTGNGSTDGPEIDLGFEPQFVILKRSSASEDWLMFDNMRGMVVGGIDPDLRPAKSQEEGSFLNYLEPNATGFKLIDPNNRSNASGSTYIYIAIRRGPLATPEAATGVFAIDQENSSEPYYTSGFPVDFALTKNANSTQGWRAYSRLTQTRELRPETNGQEGGEAKVMFDYMDGHYSGSEGSTVYSWMWKRAPGYFDVVAYSGVGTAGRTVSHNLGVAPEMMWVKERSQAENWRVYHKDVGTDAGLSLNLTSGEIPSTTFWNNTAPTDTVLSVNSNSTNESGQTYIAYLFASLPGISKVGSVSHTSGSATNVDCGFTSGARFILLKVTDSSGSWFVYDTTRGIVAGNDSRLKLDSTAAENTGNDDIDPLSSGFTITSAVSTGSYIFYAIA